MNPFPGMSPAPITNPLPAAEGGTGLQSYSVGDLLYASGTAALSKLTAASAGNVLRSGTSPSWGKVTSSYVDSSISVTGHTHAHSSITGLTSGDDHTQYALLTGRSGGQTLIGGTASGNNLTLQSTTHSTRGVVTTPSGDAFYIQDNGSTGTPCLQIGDSATGFWFAPIGSLLVATTGGVDRLVISAGGISSSVSYISPVLDAPALGTPVSGVLTNCTGTAAGLTAGNVTTNANLTGPITSVGNATSVASQTGTGTTFVMDNSPTLVTPTLGVASATSLTISGNQSAAAWTTNGIRLVGASGTLTDTTSSGTVATAYTNKLGGNTIAASSTTTFTNYVSSYFSDPVAGTNVTFTNKWALGGDSLRIGTSNHLTVTTAGVLTCTSPVFTTPTLGAASATSLTSSIVYGGTGSGGNLSLTSTTHGTKGNVVFNGISYVSSTGVFFGDLNGTLTGNVIGSVSGSSGSCTGNAATATTLQTTRTIGGSSFNGSANVTSFPEPGAIGGTTPSTIAATSLACPTFTTASGAMGFTPAAGSNFNITLSTTGDFTVNTNQLYVDTSAGNVGIGITSPDSKIHAVGTGRVAHFAGSDDTSSVYLHFNTSSSSGLGHFGVEGSTPGATITGTLAYATFLTASSSGSALQLGTPGGVRATITSGGNFCIGITAAGTSAAGVLAIKNGTQGAALTDAIQIVSEDLSAGNTILSLRTEGGGCFAAGTPAAASGSIAIKIDGTVRYFTVSNSPAA